MVDVIGLVSDDDHDNETHVNQQSPPTMEWKCPCYTVVNVNAVSIFLMCRYDLIKDENCDTRTTTPRQQQQ